MCLMQPCNKLFTGFYSNYGNIVVNNFAAFLFLLNLVYAEPEQLASFSNTSNGTYPRPSKTLTCACYFQIALKTMLILTLIIIITSIRITLP